MKRSIENRHSRASALSCIAATFAIAACGRTSDGQVDIVNGVTVTKDNANGPTLESTVALTTPRFQTHGSSFCSGTLIGENTVVTAAHCVTDLPADAVVIFGGKVDAAALALPVENVVIHKDYDPDLTLRLERNFYPSHDIAVLRFRGTRPLESRIAKVAPATLALQNGTDVTLAGFGRTGALSSGREVNDTGTLRTVDVRLEEQFARGFVFFVKGRDGLQGACAGDSGGPTYLKRDSSWFVLGALSTGNTGRVDVNSDGIADLDCIGGNFYTDLRSYATWLQSAQKALGEKVDEEETSQPSEPAPEVSERVSLTWSAEPAGNGAVRVLVRNPSQTDLGTCTLRLEARRQFTQQFLLWTTATERTYDYEGQGSLNLRGGDEATFEATDPLFGVQQLRLNGRLVRTGRLLELNLRGSCSKAVLQTERLDE